uniref:Uncharacterized protein n=1 Tax=Eptatretus burgeri TaxID=7764 RepID=A0A8C4N6T3_EPTBU
MSCQAWRPLQAENLVSSLRRFFIGGSPVLEDVSYVGIPSTFQVLLIFLEHAVVLEGFLTSKVICLSSQGERLSRYGFRTETVGTVNLKLHCIHQSRSLLEARHQRRSVRTAITGLPRESRERSIQSVLGETF